MQGRKRGANQLPICLFEGFSIQAHDAMELLSLRVIKFYLLSWVEIAEDFCSFIILQLFY
jgi:hypothetical protein